MAITESFPTGNGTAGPYTFNFEYLNAADVKVSVNGSSVTAFSLPSKYEILFTSLTPSASDVIRIYRDTDDESLSATFYPGSAIRSQDLNDNFTQNLYVTQEVNNNAVRTDGSNPMVGDLDMGGFKITNLGDPTSDGAAANKQYVDSRFGDIDIPGFTRWTLTAVGGETTLSGAGTTGGTLAYSANREQVFLNGAQQQRGVDYTADNGTNVEFAVALTAGDVVEVICVNNLNTGTTAQAQDVSFVQSGAGAVTRSVESKLQDVVSVKDFGAVGDGVTDDTAAIQAAVDYADSLGTGLVASSGVGIFFPTGIYYITSTIQIPSTLDGIGFYSSPSKGAILTTDQNITMFMVGEDLSGGGDTAGSGVTYRTTFQHLFFRSTAAADNAVAIQLNRCPITYMSNCQFWGFWKSLVGYRWNQSSINNITFNTGQTRTNASAFIELNGVYDSTQYSPGGGQHWTDLEFNATDANPIAYGVLVKSVDGLYITQSHWTSCTTASLAVIPQGTNQNKTITDVKVANCYFDNAIAGNNHVLLAGTVGSDSLYQRINFSQCLFRGTGGNSSNCVLVQVSDNGTFVSSGKLFKDLIFDQCEFTQAGSRGLYVSGSTNSHVEVTNLKVSDCSFSLNNYGNNGSLLGSGVSVEANNFSLVGNTFLADQYPALTAANWSQSGASTTTTSVLVSSNNFTDCNCSEISPYRSNLAKHVRMCIDNNTMPQKGTTISETYTSSTNGYTGGTPIIGPFTLGATEQVAVVEARIVGVSTDGTNHQVAREQRTVFKTGTGPSIAVVTDTLIRNSNSLPNNSAPTYVVPLNANGVTWAATAAYTAGQYVSTGGRVYLCITAGTTSSTAPTHTSGAALDGTVRWAYVGATSSTQFVVFVSGETGVLMDWSIDLKIITAN